MSSGNCDVEKNVPQRKLIGIKKYVLTCDNSSKVFTYIAAQNPTAANITAFKNITAKNPVILPASNKKFNCASNIAAIIKINVVEMKARTTADKIFPTTNATGSIGAAK